MRYKKIVSGLLACAMVVTSAFAGNVATVKAEGETALPTPVAEYDFNGTLGEGENAGKAVVTKLGDYDGEVVYEAGRVEGDQAVKLGDYGIKLAPANLGSDYTVSVWLKPDGTLNGNQAVFFVGYHEPEKWVGVAGNKDGSNNVKVWTNEGDGTDPDHLYDWKSVATPDLPSNKWTMMTLSQTGNALSVYQDGKLVAEDTAAAAMNGENQSIWIGVTNWDAEFTGLVDDVKVYDKALTGPQVRFLYDQKSPEEIFAEEGFTATESLSIYEGKTDTIRVNLPATGMNEQITYASDDTSIATVAANGVVTGVKAGNTTITTTVTVGGTTKTATTAVEVKDIANVNDKLAVEYDLTKAVDGKLVDKSGHENHAVLHGTAGTDYSFDTDNGATVLNLKSNNAYVDLPKAIMDSLDDKEQFTIETKFAKSSVQATNAWLFCLGSNVKSTGTNYLFLSTNFEDKALRAGIKNNSSEKLFATSIQPAANTYYTVNMVFNKGVIKLYWNGVLIKGDNGDQLNSGYSIMDDVVNPGTTGNILGYIGKSCWAPDKNWQGKVSSFKIYNKAMTDEDVQLSDPAYQEAFNKTVQEGLTESLIKGRNESLADVRYNLSLPSTLNEMSVTWKSEPNVISETGVVNNGAQDQTVKLTATVTSGALSATKDFTVTVKAMDRTALDAKIAEAQKHLGNAYLSEASKTALKKAVDNASAVTSQSEVANAITALERAISKLDYSELYKDPFGAIDESGLGATINLAPNASQAMKLTIPANIKGMVDVSYASSDNKVATISNTGVITGKGIGYARVTATVKAKYDNFTMEYQSLVKVDFSMTGVKASAGAATLAKGKTTKVNVTIPASVKNLKPSITYRATGAVSVNKSGKITAKKAGSGKVYVKVSAGGKSITRTVTVKVGEITGSSSVKVKKSITLKVKGISGKVKWSVDKSKFAKISQKGKLTAKKAGKVKVTAKVGKVTMTKTITIKKK